jgi:hypothetical protein
MTLSALARFVHVPVAEVSRWIAEGLPQTTDGMVDPFVCSNWLCAGRLDRCPTLARRWRSYLLFFAPFLTGQDRARQVLWTRMQRIYLPRPTGNLTWWLARPATMATQQIDHEAAPVVSGAQVTASNGWWCIDGAPADQEPMVAMTTSLRIAPRAVLHRGDDEHRALAAVMEEMVAAFRYEYRHHRPWEYQVAFITGEVAEARTVGSCLDAALTLGAMLTERGRPWRVIAGVVADSRIANPHFWLEVDTTMGWAPLDPTLPAIVRMVGGDWRAAVQAWTGACDARRVTLGLVDHGIEGLPGGPSCGSLMGEAVVDGANAWPCLDWVCGDCEGEFSET